jgi:hypothetical protein
MIREFIIKFMQYNKEDFLIESPDDEYITTCVIDVMRRKFILYSNEGGKNTANCETPEEFMNVLEAIRSVIPEKIIKYVDPQ